MNEIFTKAETLAFYMTLSTERLREFRRACELDMAAEQNPVTDRFCKGRISLIDQVLEQRGEKHG